MTAEPLTGALQETLTAFSASAGTPLTTTEVAERLGLERRSCYYRLDRLVETGYIETKRVGANGRVWWRPVGTDRREGPGSMDTEDHGDREELRTLVDTVEEYAIFTLDSQGRIATWNAGAEQIKGYARAEVLGEHVSTFYTDVDREAGVPERNLDAAAESGSVESEGWRVRADGSRFWARVTISALYEEDGALRGYTKVTRDMTERREREERLQRERDRLDRVLETSPVGIGVFDAEGRARRVNERFAALLGLDGDPSGYELGTRPVFDGTGTEIPYEERPAARVLADGEPVTDARLCVREGDRTRWLSVNAAPLGGEVGGVVATVADVTRLKEQADRLERQRDDLELELDEVFERIDDSVIALDEDLRVQYVSGRAAAFAGRPRSELVGEPVGEAFPDVRGIDVERAYGRAFETQEPVSFEVYHEASEAWYAANVYPSETGLSVYYQDVTARKRRERELERYETIIETVEDGIYAVDADARFTVVNEAFCALTGRSREELLGSPAMLVHADEITPRAERLAAEMASGERESATIELEVHTASGERVPCETRLAPYPAGGEQGRCGVVRDVSDRLERERQLATRVRQQAAVADLGTRALEGPPLETLFREAVELVAEMLDNEYCKVLELLPDGAELLLRSGVGWQPGLVGRATVGTDLDSQAGYTLMSEEPVVVDEMATETRFSGPDLLLDHGVRSGISVVIGSPSDPWGVLGTHDTEPRTFGEHDADFVRSVANVLATAIDRRRSERRRERQRERLAALNDLHGIVRDITEAVIEQSTREEVERVVCERLAATESYLFAWLGEVDQGTETVRLRVEAGVEGYLDGVTVSIDPADERSGGPTGQAVITREMRVANDVRAGSDHDPWREHVEGYDFRSSAAIPIVYDDTLYGVLNVYAERPYAFESEEADVLGQLGEVIGHAIASLERKRALMTDDLVELELHLPDVFTSNDAPSVDGTIRFDGAVPLGDGRFLQYGSAPVDAAGTLDALASTLPHWDGWTVLEEGFDGVGFELRLSEPPVLSLVAAHSGQVGGASIEDGDLRMRIHLPFESDVQAVIDGIRDAYPRARVVARRQVTRERVSAERLQGVLREDLTDRQQTVLKVAYLSGFFEWPRRSAGKDVAESLGVDPSTFTEHIRKAESALFGALFGGPNAAGVAGMTGTAD